MAKNSTNSRRPKPDNNRLRNYMEEIRAKQRNIVWPDPLRNSRAVDDVLWNGSRRSPVVHRIGILVFGLAYFISGAGLAATLVDKRLYFLLVLVLMLWAVAGKLLWNVVRKRT